MLKSTTSRSNDQSKLDGEAWNEDGTLKEASEMDWKNSPTKLAALATLKQAHQNNGSGEDNADQEYHDHDSHLDDIGPCQHERVKKQRVSS